MPARPAALTLRDRGRDARPDRLGPRLELDDDALARLQGERPVDALAVALASRCEEDRPGDLDLGRAVAEV